MQPSVYDQPKCPPNLKVKKKKIIIINQRSFIICQKNAGISIRDFCSGRTCSFYVLPQETAISVEAHTVDGQRPVTKVALRVNGTQISIWYIPTGKTGTTSSEIPFPLGRSIYIATAGTSNRTKVRLRISYEISRTHQRLSAFLVVKKSYYFSVHFKHLVTTIFKCRL